MRARTVHGNAKHFGAEVVLEDEPLAEKPHAPAVEADPLAAGRDAAGRVRTKEAAKELASRPRRKTYKPRDIEPAKDFAWYYQGRLGWLAHRTKEIAAALGGAPLGTGVCTRLRTAAWAWAWSEYVADLAAQSGDQARVEQAQRIAEKADKFDWSAWTLACREAEAQQETAQRDRRSTLLHKTDDGSWVPYASGESPRIGDTVQSPALAHLFGGYKSPAPSETTVVQAATPTLEELETTQPEFPAPPPAPAARAASPAPPPSPTPAAPPRTGKTFVIPKPGEECVPDRAGAIALANLIFGPRPPKGIS